MNPSSILVIGDSWSSAVVSSATWQEVDRQGWPLILGIPDANRQAVAGSTAAQWAEDYNGWLTRAKNTPADVIILSLLGNDAFAALAGGITPQEVADGITNFWRLVTMPHGARKIVLQYTDPFCGTDATKALLCSMLDAVIAEECRMTAVDTFDTKTVLNPEHFTPGSIHPNQAGHQAIADGLAQMLG
jgi:lysophospholipase L1-like esterase